MTKVREIIERVTKTLQDPDFVRWTKEELLDWVSEAQIAIARTPGAYGKAKVIPLVEGTQQQLPADAWSLLTITRNFDEDGTPLTPVRLVTRSLLDAYYPKWHMVAQHPLVDNYVYDDRFPRLFSVFPPNDGTGHVEVVYAGIPAEVVSDDATLELDDTFIPAIVSYVLYRATSKESDYAAGVQSATAWYQSYTSELSQAMQLRGQVTPTAALMPEQAVNPNGGTE